MAIHVLLVEDNPDDAFLLGAVLREDFSWRFQITHVERLSEALQLLEGRDFEVVLLDLGLPDSWGLETFLRLHQRFPEVATVVLSGLDDEEFAIKAVQAGAQDYLVKGQWDHLGLVRAIRYAIERKRVERALRESEKRYRLLAENVTDVIWTADLNGWVTYVSPSITPLTGFQPEEILARPLLAHFSPSSQRIVQEALQEVQAGEAFSGFPRTLELELLRKDGSCFWTESRVTVLRDDHNQAIGFLGSTRDITERKQAEEALRESHQRLQEALEELRRTQQQIIQQERLSALGQMASGIAHDFNNVLQPVLGGTELLLAFPDSLNDREKVIKRLQTIHTATQDAANVVRRLREFYRRNGDESFVPLHLNQVVEQAILLTQPRWKDEALARGLAYHLQRDLREVPTIEGNEGDLRQALTNLIFNAIDAMPAGGTITFRTRTENHHVVLEVSDTGVGMTEEVRRRCLEPFFSTKGQRGTGLGLAAVYGILQRHGGSIDIESQPGQGTTFILRFPIQKPNGAPVSNAAGRPLSHSLRVLCVDDEPLVREVIVSYLTQDGHIVEEANDGAEGLRKFQAGRFDLVVTDRAMPGMNGVQLGLEIKQKAPDTPVILLTGFGSLMEVTGEKPEGVDYVVGKPVTMEQLRRAIQTVVAG
jgi:PAS domain S-box-containing protein